MTHNANKLIKHKAASNMKQSCSILETCTLKLWNTFTVSVMHFLTASTFISSSSHWWFLVEKKGIFLIKFRDLVTYKGLGFLTINSWGGRFDPPLLFKFFSNNAAYLKLGSNAELPQYSRLTFKLVTWRHYFHDVISLFVRCHKVFLFPKSQITYLRKLKFRNEIE